MQAEVTNQVLEFIARKTDEAVFSPKDGYFPFSVIADAYAKGLEQGEEALKQKVRDLFIENMQITAKSVWELTEFLKGNGYQAKCFYINPNINQSLALIAVDENIYRDKAFIQLAFRKALEIQKSHRDNKHILSINFISIEGINNDLLESDGYSFKYDVKE